MSGILDSILDLAIPNCEEAVASPDSRRLVGQALLDWSACAVAGVDVRSSRLATRYAAQQEALPRASIVGSSERTSVAGAAWVNGIISHALDFDDANLLMPGHPGVVLFPPLIALAESEGLSGRALVDAYLFGIDVACRIGQWLAPGHYAQGFHATGTVGTFAAAAACARMLGADRPVLRHAIGLAATQASGLIGSFGTDAKHLHAGNAAQHGYQAASLARMGFTAREDALECRQGFADSHAGSGNVGAALATFPFGHPMHQTLFKFHASCYGTHAVLDCASHVRRDPRFDPNRIRSIEIDVGEECVRTCDIRDPKTEAQAKFSLRFNASVGLLGFQTGDLSTYSAEVCQQPDVISLQRLVRVVFVPGRPLTRADMRVIDDRGEVFERSADTSVPIEALDRQASLLLPKFEALTAGRLNDRDREELASLSQHVADLDHLEGFVSILRGARRSDSLGDQQGVCS
jgi:2-methylcitrate dehydratase PrpD